jgi:negative regulator of genetic competence, sporulation and motility
MELILINEKKLKIMLTPEDMREYEIDCDSVDYARTETRRAFWSILDEAKHRTGFDAASERVYIQLYPSREGGCEMYVTKVGLLADETNGAKGRGLLRVAQERRLAYSFGDLESLLRVCQRLLGSEHTQGSAAFIDGEGKCYLYFSGVRGFGVPDSFAVINEFGESEDPDVIIGYISEYCRCICRDNAVNTLGVLC